MPNNNASALDFVIPGIGMAANIVGGAIQRGQAVRDARLQRQQFLQDREYNTPANQLKRLKEAGLPMAAYLGGSASQQSVVGPTRPDSTDSGLGNAGEHIGSFMSTRLSRIQLEAAEQNLAILTNQRKISDWETQHALEDETTINSSRDEKGNIIEEVTVAPRIYNEKQREVMHKQANILGKQLDNHLKDFHIKSEEKMQPQKVLNAMYDWMNKERDNVLKTIQISLGNIQLSRVQEEEAYNTILRESSKQFWTSIKSGKVPEWRAIFTYALSILERSFAK